MQPSRLKTRTLILTVLSALLAPGVFGQGAPCDCQLGKIAVFDLANQVPPPTGDANAMPRWNNLFYGQLGFSTRMREGGIACASRLEDAAAWVAQHSGGGALRSGPVKLNTAPPGPIPSLDYLVTGEITGSSNAYTATARIEAAYSREVIKTASVQFTGDLEPLNPRSMRAAILSLADQLRPLSAIITAFEIRKRASDKAVARSNPDARIAFTVKPTMLDGERAQVDLTMTDCDGFPLAGREINFRRGIWNGHEVPGTTGFTLKSDAVVTDASGKASISIKARDPGAAQLVAWYGFHRPTGYPYAIVKTMPITVVPYRFQPILTLTFDERLDAGDVKYNMQGKTSYAMTFGSDGSSAFDSEARSSEDLYRLRGGVAGLKPGEKLNLYALEEDASGTAAESTFRPCTARHLLTREGQFQSWVDGKPERNETWRTFVKDSQRVHAGEVITATLTRTPQGATFQYHPLTVQSSGCEFLTSVLHLHGFTAQEKNGGLGSFVLSESELANLGQLRQHKEGQIENTVERGLGTDKLTLKVTLSGAQ